LSLALTPTFSLVRLPVDEQSMAVDPGYVVVPELGFCEIYKEYCPDLNFKNIPLHPQDYIWYAERWNGRAAMLAVIFILQWELITGQSIWEFIGVR
jgi:hypothetical protein